MMKMRTINEAAAYFKEIDPDTALTKTAIRRLVTTGTIPSTRIGTKYLVDTEKISEYLQGKCKHNPLPTGTVRRIM